MATVTPGGVRPHPEEPAFGPDDLSELALSGRSLGEVMDTVVAVTMATLPHLVGASVSLRAGREHPFETVAASSDEVRQVDEVQYRSLAGPCVRAAEQDGDVRANIPCASWPEFSDAAERIGVRAVWSIPMKPEEEAAGALNLYSGVPAPWDRPESRPAPLLARQASTLLANALALTRSEHLNATLRRALETRTVIGQAQGVLMARQGIGPEEAFDILRRASQRTNRKLREVAAELVAGAAHGGSHGSSHGPSHGSGRG